MGNWACQMVSKREACLLFSYFVVPFIVILSDQMAGIHTASTPKKIRGGRPPLSLQNYGASNILDRGMNRVCERKVSSS